MKAIRTNRSGLFLIEMVIVILAFSVTAAICVRLFSAAALTSRNSSELSRAVLIAQSAAEELKAGLGEGKFPVYYGPDFSEQGVEGAVYELSALPSERDDGVTDYKLIFIRLQDGAEIYSLTAAVYAGNGGGQ